MEKDQSHYRNPLTCLLALWLVGCQGIPETITKLSGQDVTALFEGFVYLGQRPPHSGNRNLDRSGRYPVTVTAGVEYVFNRRGDGKAADIALTVLPSRLRLLGFDVIAGPKSDGTGLVFVEDTGGPLFEIKARKGLCELSIKKSTALDPATERRWPWGRHDWEDGAYVLAASSGCKL